MFSCYKTFAPLLYLVYFCLPSLFWVKFHRLSTRKMWF
uniref:Uncharacterized protein n=1 Tax=Arundo donax TaxID=35708 RepID=A0A0A9BQM6_ARUDO